MKVLFHFKKMWKKLWGIRPQNKPDKKIKISGSWEEMTYEEIYAQFPPEALKNPYFKINLDRYMLKMKKAKCMLRSMSNMRLKNREEECNEKVG